MTHPKHPRCPKCSRSMYKSAAKGEPPGKDWICRNPECAPPTERQIKARLKLGAINANESERVRRGLPSRAVPPGLPEALAEVRAAKEEKMARPPTRAKSDRSRTTPKAPFAPAPAASTEPVSVAKARQRIRGLIAGARGDAPPAAVHLVLALVNQETGNHKAANAIIDEFQLDKLFGIQKVTT